MASFNFSHTPRNKTNLDQSKNLPVTRDKNLRKKKNVQIVANCYQHPQSQLGSKNHLKFLKYFYNNFAFLLLQLLSHISMSFNFPVSPLL